MSERNLRKFVASLLRGHRPRPFRPDEFEAEQMRAAIDLRAARPGGDAPRPKFVNELRRQLSATVDADGTPPGSTVHLHLLTRRQAIGGASIAAASAAIGAVVDRTLLPAQPGRAPVAEPAPTLVPSSGEWRPVAAIEDIPIGATHAFDVGSVTGFVHRSENELRAVSGVCTHLGCRLWLDDAAERLRCPCHSTSFAVTGELVAHQLPIAPPALPSIEVRDHRGTVEVFVPEVQA